MARYKLLCGQDGDSVANKHHVFAAMASRLCLDPSMNNEEATALAKEAVSSHLRVAVGTVNSGKAPNEQYNSKEKSKKQRDYTNNHSPCE